jgi:hypothetical protein
MEDIESKNARRHQACSRRPAAQQDLQTRPDAFFGNAHAADSSADDKNASPGKLLRARPVVCVQEKRGRGRSDLALESTNFRPNRMAE